LVLDCKYFQIFSSFWSYGS